MQYDKASLRQHYKSLRAALQPEELLEKSIAIANQCLGLQLWDHHNFHVFLSSQKNAEVNTEPLLTVLQGKEKTIVVPKIAPKEQLQNYILEEDTLLQCNAYGIPEPVTGKLLNPQKIDVVFVPLLAFDTTGQRVGYGKGYYDRFLKSCKPTVVSVGLSFFEPVEKINDCHSHDVPLHYVVSPQQQYSFT